MTNLEQLFNKVDAKKLAEKAETYHLSDPKPVLQEIFKIVQQKNRAYSSRNFDLLVELLAQWIVRNADLTKASMCCKPFHGLDLKKNRELYDFIDKKDLFKHYYVAAKHRPKDYLGEIFQEEGMERRGINLTPTHLVQMMIQMTYGDIEKKHDAQTFCWNSQKIYRINHIVRVGVPAFHIRPMEFPMETQLDPCVGTGRFLLEASIMFPRANLVLFGIDINVTMYRTCLVNMVHMSNHCFSLLCGNTFLLGTTSPSSKVWDMGNRWELPDLTPFHWKPKPKVSLLTELTNRNINRNK